MSDEAVKVKRGRAARSAPGGPETAQIGGQMLAGCAGDIVEVEQLDGRTRGVQRYKAAVEGLQQQLGGPVTVAELMLIRRCASLVSFCEAQDARQAAGDDIDMGSYAKATMTLTACLKALGIAHTSRTPKRSETIDAHSAAILDA